MTTREQLETLKKAVDIREILVTYGGVSPRAISETSTEIRCPCPIHGGDNPTGFSWLRESGSWVCFTHHCGENAIKDVFGFLGLKLNISFNEVVKLLAERYGVDISGGEPIQPDLQRYHRSVQERRRVNRFKVEVLPRLKELPDFYAAGFPTVHKYLESRKFSPDLITKFNLYPCLDSYRLLRMGIPVYDTEGALVGVNARLMDTVLAYPTEVTFENGKTLTVPKYKMNGFQKANVLYNLHNARKFSQQQGLILVEGQLDVLRLESYGIRNSVCTMGTSLSAPQVNLVCQNCVAVTFLVEEGEAARDGINRSIKALPDTLSIYLAELPSGDAGSNSREIIENTLLNKQKLSLAQLLDIKQDRLHARELLLAA